MDIARQTDIRLGTNEELPTRMWDHCVSAPSLTANPPGIRIKAGGGGIATFKHPPQP